MTLQHWQKWNGMVLWCRFMWIHVLFLKPMVAKEWLKRVQLLLCSRRKDIWHLFIPLGWSRLNTDWMTAGLKCRIETTDLESTFSDLKPKQTIFKNGYLWIEHVDQVAFCRRHDQSRGSNSYAGKMDQTWTMKCRFWILLCEITISTTSSKVVIV